MVVRPAGGPGRRAAAAGGAGGRADVALPEAPARCGGAEVRGRRARARCGATWSPYMCGGLGYRVYAGGARSCDAAGGASAVWAAQDSRMPSGRARRCELGLILVTVHDVGFMVGLGLMVRFQLRGWVLCLSAECRLRQAGLAVRETCRVSKGVCVVCKQDLCSARIAQPSKALGPDCSCCPGTRRRATTTPQRTNSACRLGPATR